VIFSKGEKVCPQILRSGLSGVWGVIPTKILTPDVVKTNRLADLKFYDGMPTKEPLFPSILEKRDGWID